MSQIASAYVLPAEKMPQLKAFCDNEDYDSFWEALAEGVEVSPAFTKYSGYVIAVLVAFLDEKECSAPYSTADNFMESVPDDLGILMYAAPEDAAAFLVGLNALDATPESLATYYEDFNDEEWSEAGAAMVAGLDWIKAGLALVQKLGGRLILSVG